MKQVSENNIFKKSGIAFYFHFQYYDLKTSYLPDSNTTLGRRWSSGVRIVGPTSESNVGPS
jgi:hypothetical protein